MKRLTKKENINTMLHYYYFGKSRMNAAAKIGLPVLLIAIGILLIEIARNGTDTGFGIAFVTIGAYGAIKPYLAIWLSRKKLTETDIDTKIEDNKLIITRYIPDTEKETGKIEIDLDQLVRVKHKHRYYILYFQGYRPMILPDSIISDDVKQYLDLQKV